MSKPSPTKILLFNRDLHHSFQLKLKFHLKQAQSDGLRCSLENFQSDYKLIIWLLMQTFEVVYPIRCLCSCHINSKRRISRGTFVFLSKKVVVYQQESGRSAHQSKLIDSTNTATLSEVQIYMVWLPENIPNKMFSFLPASKFIFKVVCEQSRHTERDSKGQ